MNSIKILTASLVLSSVWACQPKKIVQKTTTENCQSTYTLDVAPIINAKCAASCHSSKNKAYNIDLSTYELVVEEASKKRFMGSLNHEALYSKMPKKAEKLSDSTLKVIACWINSGMKK